MASSRQPNYSIDEDILLCHTYLEISQDPILGKNQRLWHRVTESYNTKKSRSMPERPLRSIDSRMHAIIAAVSKLLGCIEQVEDLNPSGASEYDIIYRAKEMMKLDPKYKGFKFDHVWDIMKESVKFDCMKQKARAGCNSSEPGTPVSDSPMSPDGLPSSFNLNLSDGSGSGSGSASKRPIGVKKAKMKKIRGDDLSVVVDEIRDSNKKLHQLFESSSTNKDRALELELRKIQAHERQLDMFQWESDNKILMLDTSSMPPAKRMYFEQEQAKILAKRQGQSTPPPFDVGSYFPDMSGAGSGSDLGDY